MIQPAGRPSSEIIMERLFAILQAVPVNNNTLAQWGMCSRRFLKFDQVPSGAIPAAFQFQNPVRESHGYDRGVGKDVFGVNWMIYFANSPDTSTVVSPPLNICYDALESALISARFDPSGNLIPASLAAGTIPARPMAQTLGFNPGQVLCYPDGPGLTDEGLLSTYSLVHLPIRIQIGM